MFLADTLSRVHPPEIHFCELSSNLEDVDYTLSLAFSDSRIQDIRQASINDSVLTTLNQVIQIGWPTSKFKMSECIRTYFNICDELTVQKVIPAKMRKELMDTIHSTHIGTEGCLRKVRKSVYWPRMSTELKETTSQTVTSV